MPGQMIHQFAVSLCFLPETSAGFPSPKVGWCCCCCCCSLPVGVCVWFGRISLVVVVLAVVIVVVTQAHLVGIIVGGSLRLDLLVGW